MSNFRVIPDRLVEAVDLNIITMDEAIDLTMSLHGCIDVGVRMTLETFLLWELEPQSKLIH